MDPEVNCYRKIPLYSSGMWLDSNPFNASVPLLLAQIATVVALSQALHSVLGRHLSQPIVVSQILTGLILGPSGLGQVEFFRRVLFSNRSWIELNVVSSVGLVMFRFVIGLKTDVTMVKGTKNKAIMIAVASRATPMLLIVVFRMVLWRQLPSDIIASDILTGISLTWTLSSFIVITFLLNELNLLNSKVGRLAISASLVDNLVDILFHLLSSTVNNTVGGGTGRFLGVVASFVALLAFMFTVARPVALWIIRRTPEGAQLDENYFVGILVLALVCGLLSELIGYHSGVGMLLLGLALPGGPPLGYTLVERLEGVITTLSIPVLMAKPGFVSDVASLANDLRFWAFLQFFVLLSIVGKFLGVMLCSVLLCSLSTVEALPLALIMCTKGFYEVELVLAWQDQQLIDYRIATTMTLSIALIAGVTTPLIKAVYKPSRQYVDSNVRTVQDAEKKGQLRILACVHQQGNVGPVIKLLESIRPTVDFPVHLVVFHLVQLVGRATTVLSPYARSKNQPAGALSESDYIVNAFLQFANQPKFPQGAVTLHPFVGISPYAIMHDDVCTLALEERAALVLLPFHKDTMIGTSQVVNVNVVNYSPSSVAILVFDEAATKSNNTTASFLNVALYFLGGADDREALALCLIMAENPKVTVTVFRFIPQGTTTDHGDRPANSDEDTRLDQEMLNRARMEKRTVYREEEVEDAEQLTTVVQSTNGNYDLLVVGRREALESPLTTGLSMWSECPELGVIGDMLASRDFKCHSAILVVQQQHLRKKITPPPPPPPAKSTSKNDANSLRLPLPPAQENIINTPTNINQ